MAVGRCDPELGVQAQEASYFGSYDVANAPVGNADFVARKTKARPTARFADEAFMKIIVKRELPLGLRGFVDDNTSACIALKGRSRFDEVNYLIHSADPSSKCRH